MKLGEKIAAGAIVSGHISADGILANKITGGQLLTALVDIVGEKGYFRITGDELRVYDNSGAIIGRFGQYDDLGTQLATFIRVSVAYKQDGSQVASDVPRYEYARQPAPVWRDTFDTDQLSQYTSGGDVAATWAVSGGVLTGMGGNWATLIKNGLSLQDVEIEINSDQAYGGGIAARYQDDNNLYALALWDDTASPTSSNLTLYKRVNGTLTNLGAVNVTWPRGTSKPIKFILNGSRLEVYFAGVKVISATDTAFSDGAVGLRISSSFAVAFRVLDFAVYHVQRGVMVEEGCSNIVAAWPTGWTAVGLTAVSQGAQSGAAGSTMRLTNSGATEGYYRSPYFALSPSTTYTLRFKVRGTIGANRFDAFVLSYTGTQIQLNGNGFPGGSWGPTGAWQTLSATFTTTADISGTSQWIRFDHDGDDAGYIEIAEVSLIQKAYPLSFPGYGAARAAETLTIPTTGILDHNVGTIEFVWTPQQPASGIISDATAPRILQVGTYGQKNSFVLDAGYVAGAEPRLYIRMRGDGGTGMGGIVVRQTGTGWYTPGQPIHFAVKWQNAITFHVYVNGVPFGPFNGSYVFTGIAGNTICLGSSTGTNFPNALYDNLRISSRARTDEEILAGYQSGKPLPVDADTTHLMSCDGHLQPTIQKFGLWLASGEIGVGTTIAGNPAGSLETQDGAQARADVAQAAAEAVAAAEAEVARSTAEAYADGIVFAEESARIAEAEVNLNAAKAYADNSVNNHNSNQSPHNLPSYCKMQSDGFKVFDSASNLRAHWGQIASGVFGGKVLHTDGSYTQMSADGLKRYIASSGKQYHYLMHVGESTTRSTVYFHGYFALPICPVRQDDPDWSYAGSVWGINKSWDVGSDPDGTGPGDYLDDIPVDLIANKTVQLPDEFKGKDFQVFLSPKKVYARSNITIYAGLSCQCGQPQSYLSVVSKDIPNGRFTVQAYTYQKFDRKRQWYGDATAGMVFPINNGSWVTTSYTEWEISRVLQGLDFGYIVIF